MIEDAALFELLSLECRVDNDGAVRHYNSLGQIHRLYGPAVKFEDGTHAWFQNGRLHRVDGPAIVDSDGSRMWYQNVRLHRLDGPAIEYTNGYNSWYINDESLTEAEWQQAVASMGLYD